jgi:hypothetical protein
VLCADLSFPISLDYRCEPLAVGCSGYFWDRVLLFAWVNLDHNPSIYLSCCRRDDRPTPPCAVFSFKMGFCKFSTWAGLELQSSQSQSLTYLGWHYYVQLLVEMESCELFTQAGLEPLSSWSQPPELLGLEK